MQKAERLDSIALLTNEKLKLLKVHAIKPDGCCTCGKEKCPTPGKHPVNNTGVYSAAFNYTPEELVNYNIGVACGFGLIVVDVDPRNGGTETLANLELAYGKLPQTWKVSTGGGGWHYYFAGYIKSFKLKGIDVQGIGKYVIAPPSLHESGKYYEWINSPEDYDLKPIPEWLFELEAAQIHNSLSNEKKATNLKSTTIEESPYSKVELLSMIDILDPDCDRETWIKIGMAIRSAGFDFEVFDVWSKKAKVENKYSPEAAAKAWKSFKDVGGVSIASLVYHAREAGWKPKPEEVCIYQPPEKPEKKTEPIIITPKAEEPQLEEPEYPPGIVGEYAEWVDSEAPKKHKNFGIQSGITAFGSIEQGHYRGSSNAKLSSYALLILVLSGGKEHYTSIVSKTIRAVNKLKHLGDIQSQQALRVALTQCNSRTMCLDEAIRFLEKISGDRAHAISQAINTDILTLWDNKDHIDGLITKKESDCVPEILNPCLSIIGGGTPDMLDRLLKQKSFSETGMISRFDFIFSNVSQDTINRRIFKNRKELVIPDKFLERLCLIDSPKKAKFDLTKYLVDKRPNLTICDEADKMYDDFVIKLETLQQLNNANVVSVLNRAAEKTLRIAAILTVADLKTEITVEYYKWARDWVWYNVQKTLEYLSLKLVDNANEGLYKLILNILGRHGDLTVRELIRKSRILQSQTPKQIGDALNTLEMHGTIEMEKAGKTKKIVLQS